MLSLHELAKDPPPGEEFCPPFMTGLFDKRILQPLDWLLTEVASEQSEPLTLDRLHALHECGWFPVLTGVGGDPNVLGAPLYAADRLQLLLTLKSKGWEPDEIRAVADYEEWMIDWVLAADDLSYEDDDKSLLIRHTESMIDMLESQVQYGDAEDGNETQRTIEQHKRFRERLPNLDWSAVPLERRNRYAKAAFQIRLQDECCRVQMLDSDRKKVESGYSPYVTFRQSQEDIYWHATLEWPSENLPVVRLPGFSLRDGRITTTETATPIEYERRWKSYGLDGYLKTWAQLRCRRICRHCLKPLADTANERRQYCGDPCRNAAKQKRFRQNHPERVIEIQERYWSRPLQLSLKLEGRNGE